MAGPPPVIPDYELLRPIGRGAYGEVWLARSVTGIYRAAKIVYRDNFDEARPFEREFAGIQRIEPLSRAEENQITILHVGRNESGGYFYYIMELADDVDTGEEINPERYVPKTLREMRARQTRLAAHECLGIAAALTRALAHLHRHGLVHRDVKPSNVVFVHGQPKLADIGLVSMIDDSASFVGTEGFVPPEGPGSVQADLYSLGKVIYEISTGRDRKEFPKLPDDLDRLPDKRALLELNEVTLKACDPDVRRRYASAQAMYDDLLLLQAGKSVKRLHLMERRFRLVAKYGVAATALSVMAAAAFLWASHQARRASDNFALSERHRVAAESALRESELNQARARRATGLAGQRFETIEVFRRLATPSNGLQVRNEAIASLMLPDVRPLKKWTKATAALWQFDKALERYATNDASGAVTIREVATDRTLAVLPGQGSPLIHLTFSDDGRSLATADRAGNAWLWNVEAPSEEQQYLSLDFPAGSRLIGFAQNNRAVIVRHANGSLHFLNTSSGAVEKSWQGPFRNDLVLFNADESLFVRLRSDTSALMVHDATDTAPVSTLKHAEGISTVAWHPNGQHLVTASGTTIHFWDARTGRELGAISQAHESRVVGLHFDGTGEVLASTAWDSVTRVWQPATRRELVRALQSGNALRLSPDGTRLGFQGWNYGTAELWEVAAGREVRRVDVAHGTPAPYRTTHRGGFSADGALLFLHAHDGIVFFDAARLSCIGVIAGVYGSGAAFDRQHGFIAVNGAGLMTWPLTRQGVYDFTLGPAEPFRSAMLRTDAIAVSADGERIALLKAEKLQVVEGASGRVIANATLEDRTRGALAISGNGRWIALGSRTKGIQVRDANTGLVATNVAAGGDRRALFSPDGRWMLTLSLEQYELFETGSWKRHRQVARPYNHGTWPAAAFTSDSRIVALAFADPSVGLYVVETGELLGTLPSRRMLAHLDFSPDNTRLLVTYEPGFAEIFDLPRIHTGLLNLGLGWTNSLPHWPGTQRSSAEVPPPPATLTILTNSAAAMTRAAAGQ